jgi:hypothetical protein
VLASLARDVRRLGLQRRAAHRLGNRWTRATTQRIVAAPSTWPAWEAAIDTLTPAAITDAAALVSAALPLRGAGEVVGIADSGLDMQSCFFGDSAWTQAHSGRLAPVTDLSVRGADLKARAPTADDRTHRKVIQYVTIADSTDNAFGHGTHTGGSLAGSALVADSEHAQFNGMASDAKVAFYDIGAASGEISIPNDLENDLFMWAYLAGANTCWCSSGSRVIHSVF